jgi:hypothetical protein
MSVQFERNTQLTTLSISSPPLARQTISKLTASLNMFNRASISLDASLLAINKLADGVVGRLDSGKKTVADLTKVDKVQLSSELFSAQSQLAAYQTIDQIKAHSS